MHRGSIVILILCASLASAQTASPAWEMFRQNVKPGDRVRVETVGRPITGSVERITGDAVGVRHAGQITDYSTNDVRRIYKLGNRGRHAARTTVIGLGVGVGAGAVVGVAASHGSDYTGLITALFAIVGGIAGTVAGAVIGASTSSQKTLVYEHP